MADDITISFDGQEVKTQPGKMVLEAAIEAGVYVPYLCYHPGMKPFAACRMGMSHLLEVLERICCLEGTEEDLTLMRSIGESMQAGSLCGHGQLGFNPVSSALRYFGPDFEEHIVDRTCRTGVCSMPRFSPAASRR